MKKRQIIIIVGAVVILAIGFGVSRFLASMKEAPARKEAQKSYKLVRARSIDNDTLTQRTPIQGKLIAREKVEIFPEVTGKLLATDKPFKVGQHYDNGEVMLAIDGSESLLTLRSQRSGFISLLAQVLPDIKIDYPAAFSTWKDYQAELDPESTLPALPHANDPQLKSFLSGRNIFQQYYAIKSLENRQSKFTITAPFSGTVTMGSVNAGTVIRAGAKVGEMIRDGAFELEAAVPAEDAGLIDVGDEARLMLHKRGKTIHGKVVRMASNVSPNDQRVTIYIGVNDPDLREGMYLEGVIDVAQVLEAVSIDRNLVTPDGYVFLVQDSILVKRDVQVQDLFDETALITGLKNGDMLLDQVVEGAYEGMLVKTETK